LWFLFFFGWSWHISGVWLLGVPLAVLAISPVLLLDYWGGGGQRVEQGI
jgi:hypothetical protein